MEIKKICFLAGIYPTEKNPNAAIFYQNLVNEYAKIGIECRVIFPKAMNLGRFLESPERIDYVDEKHTVKVYRPKTISLGAKRIGPWNTAYASAVLYSLSAMKKLESMAWKPDIIYSHFISPSGIMAAQLSKKIGIPAFVAYGESEPWSINTIGIHRSKKELKDIAGFISVSSKNKRDLIDLEIAQKDKIKVFPNSINDKVFYKRDKIEARKRMGWDSKSFIVAFVGHFNQRKGVLRLDKAMKNIPQALVAYAGNGKLRPTSPNTLHSGDISPEMMPWFLSAADVFVLPTLNEGSCNAIIEAMACGLPIISSDRDFNRDILSEQNALLVDPNNVNEIENALLKIINSKELRLKLSMESIKTSKKLVIRNRASDILNWMEMQCSNYYGNK